MGEICRLNARVKHRAWKWEATVVDFPFEHNTLSNVTVVRDDTGKEEEAWVPALMTIEDEEEWDWNE